MQLQPNLILRSPTPTRTMTHLRRTQLLLGYICWICQLRGFPVWITVPTKWFLSMASALKICFVGEPSPWSGWVFFTQVDLSSVLGVGNGSALVRFQWMFVKRIPNDQQISDSLLSNRFSTQTWVVPPIRWLGTLYNYSTPKKMQQKAYNWSCENSGKHKCKLKCFYLLGVY